MEIDCDNRETAMASLQEAFYCSDTVLTELLLSTNLEKYYETVSPEDHAHDYLYQRAIKELGNHKDITSVCWFHTTRTESENNFIDGLKPLGLVLPDLLDLILRNAPSLAERKMLEIRISDKSFGRQYKSRSEDPSHWGPFAILVKEVALKAYGVDQTDRELNHHELIFGQASPQEHAAETKTKNEKCEATAELE